MAVPENTIQERIQALKESRKAAAEQHAQASAFLRETEVKIHAMDGAIAVLEDLLKTEAAGGAVETEVKG